MVFQRELVNSGILPIDDSEIKLPFESIFPWYSKVISSRGSITYKENNTSVTLNSEGYGLVNLSGRDDYLSFGDDCGIEGYVILLQIDNGKIIQSKYYRLSEKTKVPKETTLCVFQGKPGQNITWTWEPFPYGTLRGDAKEYLYFQWRSWRVF